MAKKQFKCNVCGYVHEGAAAPDVCPVCGAPASEFTQIGKKGFDTNNNTYIIIYSVVMVVIVATLLAVASLALKDRQNRNMLGEKKQSILISLYQQEAAEKDVKAEEYVKQIDFDETIKYYVLDKEGHAIEGEDIFALLDDLTGAFNAGKYPVFESRDGRMVLPVIGTGLWGPVWGYVALEKDMNTVVGVVFSHSGETPGLGAEIATPKHWALYIGKTIFEGDKFVSVTLRKGGAQDEAHEVDAISGGTKTSDGVSAMLYNSLEKYLPLLETRRGAVGTGEHSGSVAQPCDMSNEENVENNE